jgi:predicted NBD/HSP70 family sugar kinase
MPHKKTLDFLDAFTDTALTGVASKDRNRKRRILSEMSLREEITINDISDLLNISVPKTTELLADLSSYGLVRETGKRTEGPGRKASYFTLSSDSCYFLGVEIKKYKINIGLMGFDRKIIYAKADVPFFYLEAGQSLQEISRIILAFLSEAPVDRAKIVALGLSISGRVNVKTGQILTMYHFADAPVKSFLEETLKLPVYIDNDSRTIAYGEFHFGERTTENEALILNLDYGMALGIFVKGEPVYGVSGYAGELGHIPLFDNEKICFCGKKGCMETEASGGALIEDLIRKMEQGSNSILQPAYREKGILELEAVVDAINKGDNLALSALGGMAAKLGRGLAVTINIFNPELIVIGGSLSAVGEALLLPVKSFILRHSLSVVNNDTRVVLSTLHEKAGLLGCCLLVRNKVLGLVGQ